MGIRLQILWFRHISHQGSRDGDMLQQYANNEEKSKKGMDLIQQYANNDEKSRKGTYLIQQYENNEEKSRNGTNLIQPFGSEKKHSGQSGSDPGMQICKADAEEVLLLKPTR